MEQEQKKKEPRGMVRPPRLITFSRLPYLLLTLFSALLVGLTELLKPNFQWDFFLSASYWYNVVLLNIATLLISLAALFKKSDELIEKDKDGIIAQNTEALNKIAPNIQDKMVDEFIDNTNRDIKKEVFCSKVRHKLYKLEKNVTFKNHTKYLTFVKTNDMKEKEILAENKYIKKRLRYEKELEDQWLEDHIDVINVKKCPKLTRSFLTIGINTSNTQDFPTAKVVIIARGLLPKFCLTAALTLIVYSFGLDIQRLGWISAVTLTYKLICLILNWIYGTRFADQYVKESVIDVLYMRIRWLVRFQEWKKEKKEQEKKIELEKLSQQIQDTPMQIFTDTGYEVNP